MRENDMKILKISSKPILVMLVLFSIHTLSKPAMAQYDVNNTGVSDVNGLTGSDVQSAIGSNFGTVSAIADTNNAYALFGDGNNIEINGEFPTDGVIYAEAGNNGAYGLHADGSGVITTGAINGTVTATAGNEYAYGLYSTNSITTGDVNGTIAASANLGAYGLRSINDSISTGIINGVITAIADTNSAYGLYAGTTITTGAINGSISATALNDSAYGLFANGLITTGDVNGTISASANSNAYGLRSLNDSIAAGAISGTISATATNESAYGLFANNSITTGDVNGTIEASAYSDAYGLRASAGSITTGVIDGIISAITDTNSAYGLYSNTTVSAGNINGTISATAGNDDAYGFFANGSITIGDVNGTIEATANSNAYGLRSYAGSITTDVIDGTITSTADANSAYGLSAYTSITTGDIEADIEVSAGSNNAFGLESGNKITTGNINGAIIVNAGGNNAYGLKSSNGMSIGDISNDIYARTGDSGAYAIFGSGDQITIGSIDGTVYGWSDTNDAFGIYSYSDSVTTGEISGNVWGYAAGEYAYGILSYGAMDITINGGFVAGLADANSSTGIAIQSGRLNSHVLTTQNANDSVEIVAGSRILGDIDLGMSGTDSDVLTLSGDDANSTTLDEDLKNIETINLTGGTWYLNGTVSDNANGITMTGGVLGGTGTLGSLNVSDGTLAPGNSIGTTTVDGDLTLGTDSTLEIEVDNSGNSDKVVVTGDITINNGTLKTVSTETISSTHEYTIIEANNVSGEFDVVDTALLQTLLSEAQVGVDYQTDSVILTVTPERFDNSDLFVTANQRSVGSALQIIADNGGSDVTTGLQQLANIGQVRDAYDQLCGQTRTSLASVSALGNKRFTDTVSNRLHNTQNVFSSESYNGPLFAMAQPDRDTSMYDTGKSLNSFAIGNGTGYFASEMWGLWMRGYGVFGERESQIESPGYQYRIYGTGFGMDYKCSKELLLGITGGYSNGHVDYSSSRDESDITSTPIGIYGSWFTKSGYIDSIFSYSSMKYETKRYVDLTSEKLEGEFDGYETSTYLEAGRNWFLGKDFLVQPMTSFQFSYLNLDSYSETGGVSALTFDEQSYKSYKGSLGMKVKTHLGEYKEYESLTLELRGRWVHEFGDTKSNINANFTSNPSAIFKVSDQALPRDSAVLGIGLRQIEKENMMYYIDYDTSLNKEDTSHVISAGLRYRW
ncbi:MAG: autotransporter domain-containing protein [Sedimentisphaerales bacterium]|nr:autotransporter domain-containing protein [Sedimentisphaerales bacterium]